MVPVHEIRCCRCDGRLVRIGSKTECLLAFAKHLDDIHQRRKVMMIQGTDFDLFLALHRCDLCGTVVEPPWWVYRTRGEPDFSAASGDWLVCDSCHVLVQVGTPEELMQRAITEQCMAGIVDPHEVAELVHDQFEQFLSHLDGVPWREFANSVT